jgi:hypothetical protein
MSLAYGSEPASTFVQPCVWLDWDKYLAWLSGRVTSVTTSWGEKVKLGPPWQPGEHMALDGPTGEGKTTHAVGILAARKYVLALDPKGEDETLSASGYVRVRSIYQDNMRWRLSHRQDARTWNDIHKRIDDGLDARVIVGGGSSSDAEDLALQKLMREAIIYSRHSGGWTLYVDEFELLSSQRMFNEGPRIERMLITARRKKTSVVTSFQAPAWISHHATRQARRAVKWPTGDVDMVQRLARAMGRDWRDVGQAVDQLPPFHTLTIPRGKFHPMVMTSAPELQTGMQRPGRPLRQAVPPGRARQQPGQPGSARRP